MYTTYGLLKYELWRTILPIISDYSYSPISPLNDSSDSYSAIFPILRVKRDFFFRLSSDSADFSDSKILLIIDTNLRSKSELEPFKLLFYNMITHNTL